MTDRRLRLLMTLTVALMTAAVLLFFAGVAWMDNGLIGMACTAALAGLVCSVVGLRACR